MTQRLLPDPDLEALIRGLNTAARHAPADPAAPEALEETADTAPGGTAPAPKTYPLPPRAEEAEQRLARLLQAAQRLHASDLLLVAGTRPTVRVDGRLAPLEEPELDAGASAALCSALAPSARRADLQARGSADFALSGAGIGRLRCNVHRAGGRWCAAVRLLPAKVPDFDELGLPDVLDRFCDLEYGLVLVTGPTGVGKSTTLAAMMRRILSRRQLHAITIEDPVEYAHPHGGSVVEHVEIGRDAASFAGALRSALRQNPDVLLVGEMRDPESIAIAITAAETGHLVLSTLHTGDGPQTVHRILDSYPPGQAEQVRAQLSVSLAGIVSQQLLPRLDGRGRVPAIEVLIATHGVRNLIRQGKIAHLRGQIGLERQAGMLALDESLARLVRDGIIDHDQARARARTPEEFDLLVKR
jgi:twitching motility protein PilT